MKIFRNLLIATAAVAAIATTAAFAEGETATYTDGTVAVSGFDNTQFGDQVTVVIVPDGTTNITEEDIYYINQDSSTGITTILAGMGMKDLTETDPTAYEVWIGGSTVSDSNPIIKIDFTTATTPEIIYGDVDGLSGVTASDATTILQHCAEMITLSEDMIKRADVDGLSGVTASDATTVLQYCAEMIPQLPLTSAE